MRVQLCQHLNTDHTNVRADNAVVAEQVINKEQQERRNNIRNGQKFKLHVDDLLDKPDAHIQENRQKQE